MSFIYTINLRSEWFGKLGVYGHSPCTGNTLVSARNWFREGLFNLKFAQVLAPKSVEYQGIENRYIYYSYPGGHVYPIYFLSKILNTEPNLKLIMGYNLANHFLIALILCLFVFWVLIELKLSALTSFIFALIPPSIVLFLKAPAYWLQNIYFADEAVLLPVTIYLTIEILKDINSFFRESKFFNIFQQIICFYGAFVDYFFYFVLLVVFIKKILTGELNIRKFQLFLKKSFFFAFPALLAIFIFFLEHLWWGTIKSIFLTAQYRAGFDITLGSFYKNFWLTHFVFNFEILSLKLIFVSFGFIVIFAPFYYFLSKKIRDTLTMRRIKISYITINLFLLPCTLQVYLIRNHSAIHSFAALKFILPLAIIPFVFLPVLCLSLLNHYVIQYSVFRKYGYTSWRIFILSAIISFFVGGLHFTKNQFYQYTGIFKDSFRVDKRERHKLYNFVYNNTDFEDIIFANKPSFDINKILQRSLMMKHIHFIENTNLKTLTESIYKTVKNIKAKYNINILLIHSNMEKSIYPNYIKQLINRSFQLQSVRDESLNEKYTLIKISKDEFIKLLQQRLL